MVALVVLLFATIWFTPYGSSAGSGGQPFAVKAEQFAFLVPSTTTEGREAGAVPPHVG